MKKIVMLSVLTTFLAVSSLGCGISDTDADWWLWLRERGTHQELFEALDNYISVNY